MLELSGVTKLYTPTTGVKNICVSIPCGQIVAFVGLNGAGKSTLFNIVGRVLKADSGTCTFEGSPLDSMRISEVGFLPESMYLLEDFTPLQMVRFMNTMKEFDAAETEIDALLCRFGIDTYGNKKIKKLSQGMRKRVELVCALLGDPKLLILDEPLNSLDIQGVLAFKDMLKDFKARGAVVLLSSHILDFLDTTVDQVVFLKHGEIVEICSDLSERVEDLYRKHIL